MDEDSGHGWMISRGIDRGLGKGSRADPWRIRHGRRNEFEKIFEYGINYGSPKQGYGQLSGWGI